MIYQHILFDLDGTLIDPEKGIRDSFRYTLKKMKLNLSIEERFSELIGPPLHHGFEKVLGLDAKTADQAVAIYREYYAREGLYESRLYDGIFELLKDLHSEGRYLYLATSKLEKFAIEILHFLKIHTFFSKVAGASYKGKGADKEFLLQTIMKEFSAEDKHRSVMVGDTHFDIIGARKVGIDSFGVLYGFGSKEDLIGAGASRIISDIPHLRQELFGEIETSLS